MPTLKEAVESGRRWRHKTWPVTAWAGPGTPTPAIWNQDIIEQALSSDFEIEPEPEKPREWTIANDLTGWGVCDVRLCGHHSTYTHVRVHDADACDRIHGPCGGNKKAGRCG